MWRAGQARELSEVQAAGVNRHTERGVHVHGDIQTAQRGSKDQQSDALRRRGGR